MKDKEILNKYKPLHRKCVNVALPTVENSGIIAVEISEINDNLNLTAQEQAFFVAGFQSCVDYLEKQRLNIEENGI